MVGVVEADGDEIADVGDAGADARRAAHRRQALRLDLGEAREDARREGRAVDVGDDLAQVADLAGRVDEPRLFLARPAVADQFHARFPPFEPSAPSAASAAPALAQPRAVDNETAPRARGALLLANETDAS